MIYNSQIDRLMEVDIVQTFMRHQDMQGKPCGKGDNCSLILYKFPYVVEFHDALIENYLEITLSDISKDLLLTGSRATEICLEIGLQNIEDLKIRNFNEHTKNNIFISEGARKMFDLYCDLEAIDKIIPLLKKSDDSSSMLKDAFDSRFDFKDYVIPMYFGLKEKYLNCIE